MSVAKSLLWHLNNIMPEAPFPGAGLEEYTIPTQWQVTQLCADIVSQSGDSINVGDMVYNQQPSRRVNTAMGMNSSPQIPEDLYCQEIGAGIHLHGYEALCNALKQNGKRFQRRPQNEQRPEPNPASTFRRRNQRPKYNGICAACGRYGHEPPQCDFLAMYVWSKKYLRYVSKSILEENERNWLERNKRFLGENKENTPSKVAMAYAEKLGCDSINHLTEIADAELDWDYFEPQADDEPIVVDNE